MTDLESHLLHQIESVFRNPTGVLKHPFLVPGGIFQDELWDWDSYWFTKGILGIGAAAAPDILKRFLEHAKGSWINFFENQAANGSIPIMIKGNNPDPLGCTGDSGIERNQAKPVFGQFALDISRYVGDFNWVAPYFDGLLRFYSRWDSRYKNPCGLYVWGSDVAIGVDNDPATFGRPEFSSANLLLNCLLCRDLKAAIEIANALHREGDAARLGGMAKDLQAAIQSECWDTIDGFFYSVDVQVRDGRGKYLPGIPQGMSMAWRTLPIKIKTFAGFLPMWSGIATANQARILVERHLHNSSEFDAPWGVPSLARNERMYNSEENSANPSNWLGPVWILASYLVYEGLCRYGYESEARALAAKTHALLNLDLEKTGQLHECYHPDTGKPNFNGGFLSWNVLASLMK